MYHLFETEMKSISTLNSVALGFFSLSKQEGSLRT
jgi:hypothetical protein